MYWQEFLPSKPDDPLEARALEQYLRWCLNRSRNPATQSSLDDYAESLRPKFYLRRPDLWLDDMNVSLYYSFRKDFPRWTWRRYIRAVPSLNLR